MRFRGKLVDIECIQHFSGVVTTISKLAKQCVLRLTPNKLYFVLSERAGSGSIWCELPQSHFFNEYLVDGVSPEQNEIFLDLQTESLVKSLRSAHNAKSVKLKLTKKQTPSLTLEIELPSLTSHARVVVHDVPVAVIPRRRWAEYEEPALPDFDVSIYIPSVKTLRHIVERMKNLSNFVTLSVNGEGELKLEVGTDLANLTTHFRHLETPTWSKDGESESEKTPRPPHDFAGARVDIRLLAQFLNSLQSNTPRVVCNIVDEELAHFFLLHEDISLQYFLPAISS